MRLGDIANEQAAKPSSEADRWKKLVDECYAEIPDLGGFVLDADWAAGGRGEEANANRAGAINAVAAAHGNIPVIEDGAQSFGATYRGRKSCALSTFGTTSFFPSKPLGCYGDGGALFTDDDDLATTAREIRTHGQSKRYVHTRIGVGGRMDTLQCAVLLAKWPRFPWEVAERERIGQRYGRLLAEAIPGFRSLDIADLRSPLEGARGLTVLPDRTCVHAQYTILVPRRAAVQQRLNAVGIPTAVHYPLALNEQPAYRDLCSDEPTPVSAWLAQHVISLPMGPDLSAADQDTIVGRLQEVVRTTGL